MYSIKKQVKYACFLFFYYFRLIFFQSYIIISLSVRKILTSHTPVASKNKTKEKIKNEEKD